MRKVILIYCYFHFPFVPATFSPCEPWDHKSDNHCEPGFICSNGMCKLASTCLSNRDCKNGFECNPPYCESSSAQNDTVSTNSTETMKIDLQETYRASYSSSFTKILIEDCNCYRFIPSNDNSKTQAMKSQVIFNKQRVNGSFCGIVSDISINIRIELYFYIIMII